MEYYQKSLKELFLELKSDSNGLKSTEAKNRLYRFGYNKISGTKKPSLFLKFLSQFKDILGIILLVAAFLALFIGDPRDAMVILAIVFINAIIGFVQEYKAEKILAVFKKHLPSMSKVLRDGRLQKIYTYQIVPGDILVLEEGDSVGADSRLIEAFDLKTNEFSLTGESVSQPKKVYEIKNPINILGVNNSVFMGTTIATGQARALVVKTGNESEFGRIAQKSQKIKEEPTPLQKELIHTGKTTAKIAILVAVFVLVLLTIFGRDLKESLLFALAAGVAMVPEGLPAAMSVALSLGAQRMLKKNALVKKLLHVESLGSVTAICTDKTGTLTTGVMTVNQIFPEAKKSPFKDLFIKAFILCNNASIKGQAIGDPVDIALLKYAEEQTKNFEKVQKTLPKVFEIPFSSKRKMMSVVVKEDNHFIVFTKGAPHELMKRCRLDQKTKQEFTEKIDEMANKGQKVIAAAYKDLGKNKNYHKDGIEKDLNFLGLIALLDPPREKVKEAIEMCEDAKIRVIMITGDYSLTAKTIGEKIGLVDEHTQIINGDELHKMDDEKLKNIISGDVLFARIDPEQKLRIIENLQEKGEIVAVTGDGVNDVPALVKADIGVAMGVIGTDVAKEAGDMILLDDHFATIVDAIKEGRRIFNNARKFVFYVFSSNSGELLAPLFGILLGLPLPLIAVQILAIDLGTDVFPSLALGVEKEDSGLMKGPPVSKSEKIMNPKMLTHLLEVGLVMGVMGIVVFLVTLYSGGWHWGEGLSTNSRLYFSATAAVYSTLVLCQVANAFSCRSRRESIFKIGLFSNIWLIYAEIISGIMLALIIFFPPLQRAFRIAPPPAFVWLLIFGSFFIFLLIFELRKKYLSRYSKH